MIPIYLKSFTGSHWFLGFPPEKVSDLHGNGVKYVVANIALDKTNRAEYVIVDLTADQTDEDCEYNQGVRKVFQYPSPSLRAQNLARVLDLGKVCRLGHRAWWKMPKPRQSSRADRG